MAKKILRGREFFVFPSCAMCMYIVYIEWKLRQFSPTTHIWQKFRESNVFTKEITRVELTNYFLSGTKFSIFPQYTVPQGGSYGNSLSRILGKNFVKVTVLLNKSLNS